MSDLAIRVENLGKRYHIGGAQTRYKTLRETLISAASAPVRWLKGQRHEENMFWALQDVSFEIKQGEAVGIIGRNGAGKSTLLKILSRITKPTTGRVELFGRVGSLLEVGTGFHNELTGRDNIYLNGAILGMSRQEIMRKFDEIVAFAEVEKFLDTPVKYYSSGMYVRLAFAVAAHLDPEILVVDEVLAVGDAQFQRKCLGKMGKATQDGRTVLFVSHNMGAVSQLCSRAIILKRGKISLDCDTASAISAYLSEIAGTNHAIEYPIEPDRDIQINSIFISLPDGTVVGSCKHNQPFCVNVKYTVRNWKLGSYICLDVFNELDSRILWSSDTKSVDEMMNPRNSGTYQARITIPANVLSPGMYLFTVANYGPGQMKAYEVKDRAISVDIEDGGTLLSNFGIKWHAATTVPLEWEVKQVSP